MNITLLPVSDDNIDVAIAAYASTRELELSVVPWTDEQKMAFVRMQFQAQQADYQRRFPAAQHQIIYADDQPAGRLYRARTEDSLRILDITLLPALRNRGIGTQILKDLMAEARATALAVRIYVEHYNPSLGLFERLGFVKVDELGDNYLMQWKYQEGIGMRGEESRQ